MDVECHHICKTLDCSPDNVIENDKPLVCDSIKSQPNVLPAFFLDLHIILVLSCSLPVRIHLVVPSTSSATLRNIFLCRFYFIG